ncbi:putative Helix-turn-helix domain-containing protein 1 [Homarus americanus]|uniref:Putative Helix-turn-helix domain-containing protein 1 n=1 Tax=Homarus americanus TaxID=6706 RepID=A0A8J5ML19_HOMAM|nr:putative Helix-turn-helix domain-containing protein 1 [Homarus americanus]
MGSGKELGRDTIVAIITPYKEGYKCKDIATRVGIGVQQVQKWIKKFRDGGGEDIPTPKPRSGRPRKIQNRTSKVIKRQLDKNPTLTARKLKENNPALLQDVFLIIYSKIYNIAVVVLKFFPS